MKEGANAHRSCYRLQLTLRFSHATSRLYTDTTTWAVFVLRFMLEGWVCTFKIHFFQKCLTKSVLISLNVFKAFGWRANKTIFRIVTYCENISCAVNGGSLHMFSKPNLKKKNTRTFFLLFYKYGSSWLSDNKNKQSALRVVPVLSLLHFNLGL